MAFDRIIKGGNVVTPAGSFVGDVGITELMGLPGNSPRTTEVRGMRQCHNAVSRLSRPLLPWKSRSVTHD